MQGLSGEANSGSPWWKAKKWVLHITYRLFSRYSMPKHCKEGNDKAFSDMFVVSASGEHSRLHCAAMSGGQQQCESAQVGLVVQEHALGPSVFRSVTAR